MSKLSKAPQGQCWQTSNDGRVAFLAPADYATHREPDETVAVYPPGNESGVTLRLSLHPESLQPELSNDVSGAIRDRSCVRARFAADACGWKIFHSQKLDNIRCGRRQK